MQHGCNTERQITPINSPLTPANPFEAVQIQDSKTPRPAAFANLLNALDEGIKRKIEENQVDDFDEDDSLRNDNADLGLNYPGG